VKSKTQSLRFSSGWMRNSECPTGMSWEPVRDEARKISGNQATRKNPAVISNKPATVPEAPVPSKAETPKAASLFDSAPEPVRVVSMTGTLTVGAVRSLGDEQLKPAALLARLNRQIQRAQKGGFVTCLCVRITANGQLTAANAGHLAPYRNGEEVKIEPGFQLGLPLAIAADTEYVETSLLLDPWDTLSSSIT
jgi:hypothetical protein